MNLHRPARTLAPLALATAALMAGASSAGAATAGPSHVRAVRGALRMFGRTLPSSIPASLLPAGVSSAAASTTALELFTEPTPLTIHGATYQMSMGAFSDGTSFGSFPQMELALDRTQKTGGKVTTEQEHVYGYTASDMTMSATANLSTLAFHSGSSFPGTDINSTFTEVARNSSPCRLFPSGSGVAVDARGTLASSPFKVNTGTSPFFGTITKSPTAAEAIADPGCGELSTGSGGGTSITFTGGSGYLPCNGRETVVAGAVFGTSLWGAQVGYGGGKALTVTESGTTTQTQGVSHLGVSLQDATNLPPATLSTHGATARVDTTGDPLFAGSAIFFSKHAPHVSTVQSCSYERHVHRYRAYRYAGGMKPSATSPLEARFDTGDVAFHGQAAALIIRKYLS